MKVTGSHLVVEFGFDPVSAEVVKRLARRFGQRRCWDPEHKIWLLPIAAAPAAAVELGHFGRCPVTESMLREHLKAERIRKEKMGGALNPDLMKTPDGRALFDHQKEAVTRMLQGSLVLAHDMGLGKTLSTLTAIKHMQSGGVLAAEQSAFAVVPPSLISQWKDEAGNLGVWIELISWGKIPAQVGDGGKEYVLVCDEAHNLQTLESKRTQSVIRLSRDPRCLAAWMLTGTPMRNGQPKNLYPLLMIAGHPLSLDRRAFEERYCDGKETKWTSWDVSGASNLPELREKTKGVILRRSKAECLDLPPFTRVVRSVEPAKESLKLYETTFWDAYQAYCAQVNRGEKNASSKHVVMLNMIRRAASIGKAMSAVEIAEEIIDEGHQVVVFADYVDTVNAIAHHLKVFPFTGRGSELDRSMALKLFKSGDAPAFVATAKSGGQGLDLQNASYVIMVDRPFSPGDVSQAEDRIVRIGQTRPTTSIWMQAFPVDHTVDEMLLAKNQNISQAINGSAVLTATDALGELFKLRVKGHKVTKP